VICPVAPPGAQAYANTLTGYVLWGVLALMLRRRRRLDRRRRRRARLLHAARQQGRRRRRRRGLRGGRRLHGCPGHARGHHRVRLRLMAPQPPPSTRGIAAAWCAPWSGRDGGRAAARWSRLRRRTPRSTSTTNRAWGRWTQPGRRAAALGSARRDAIAAAPDAGRPPEASRSGTPATRPIPTMTLPYGGPGRPRRTSPTGFPKTPEGAIGPAGRDRDHRPAGHVHRPCTRQVHAAWSHQVRWAGESWELTGNVAAFLSSGAGQYADSHPRGGRGHTRGRPNQRRRRRRVGPGLRPARHQGPPPPRHASPTATANACSGPPKKAAGGCIGPGTEPARAPSTWPETDLAARPVGRP
jgi:hypothetical protein